jgi:hypothetical protein
LCQFDHTHLPDLAPQSAVAMSAAKTPRVMCIV